MNEAVVALSRPLFGAPLWSAALPVIGLIALDSVWHRDLNWWWLMLVAASLLAGVAVAVHHTEVIALRVGEPFGTLILALAVTVIEVSLIAALMLSGGDTGRTHLGVVP